MDPEGKRYIVGIDLGTTNSAVTYVDLNQAGSDPPEVRLFRIPQLTAPGEVSRLAVLPSFLYNPGRYDIDRSALRLPWDAAGEPVVGSLARDHGAKVPDRLVSSAKSWLCHPGVDRRAPILPWGVGDEIRKRSPVQVTSAYLDHVRRAWNHGKVVDEEGHLENQVVVLTVPASFDEVARDLTLEAAAAAHLPNVILLEEPLAAFYSWLLRHPKDWGRHLHPGELILVCDMGGGTTDFTLISLCEAAGSPRFERIAVGDHLILGGDNIDLALARKVEQQLGGPRAGIRGDRWKALCHQCRQAKEFLLEGRGRAHKISLAGTGSRLIAGSLSTELSVGTVEQIALEGFFPLIDPQTEKSVAARRGIAEFGLPYEPDPAVTRHLLEFIERHRQTVQTVLGWDDPMPEHVLFNGGSLKPAPIRERIRASIRRHFAPAREVLPHELDNPFPDLAVAYGAAYYGLVKIGRGVRVGSGSPRAYFLKVDHRRSLPGPEQAVCLVERGLDEGSRMELHEHRFEVRANQPVSFEIYSSSYRSGDRCGDLVAVDESLTALPPLNTVVQFGQKGLQGRIPVGMEADYTETGTLALWLRSLSSSHRWSLQFQLRNRPPEIGVGDAQVYEQARVERALETITTAFSDSGNPQDLLELPRRLGAVVGDRREDWPLGFIRSLADRLLELQVLGRSSPERESRWMNLTGFCLRPGFGVGFDEQRVKHLWKIHRQGPAFGAKPQVRSEWWTLWRRVAGGLTAGRQRQFLQAVTPLLAGGKTPAGRTAAQERMEIWMALSSMEMLRVKDKIVWGRRLLAEVHPRKSKPQHIWALSRFGGRELFQGSADRVVPPAEAVCWIDTLLAMPWRNRRAVVGALIHMARRTGDRARDLPDPAVDRYLEWLTRYADPKVSTCCLRQVVSLAADDRTAIFGESLPSGLTLRG